MSYSSYVDIGIMSIFLFVFLMLPFISKHTTFFLVKIHSKLDLLLLLWFLIPPILWFSFLKSILMHTYNSKGFLRTVYLNMISLFVVWIWICTFASLHLPLIFDNFPLCVIINIFVWIYYPLIVTCASFRFTFYSNTKKRH